MTARDEGPLGSLVPPDLLELLRGQALRLARPIWGQRYGRHASARGGVGLEFRDHRPYVPGDDPRMLDWRAVARRDRLVLRQTESEDELNLVLAIDGSGNMAYGEGDQRKAHVANAVAGGLGWLAIRQGDAVGLACGTDGEVTTGLARPLSGHDRLRAIVHRLSSLELRGVCQWPELLAALAPRLPRRSLLVLFSDFLDPTSASSDREGAEHNLLRGLSQLRARGHDVVIVQILHRDELEFPWTGRALLRFEDLGGVRQSIEGSGSLLREAYLRNLERHLDWLDKQCEESGLFLHRFITDEPLVGAFVAMLGRMAGAPIAREQRARP